MVFGYSVMDTVSGDDEDNGFRLSPEQRKEFYGDGFDPTRKDFVESDAEQRYLIYGADISRNWKLIRGWDDTVSNYEKNRINDLPIHNNPHRCPLIQFPSGAAYFCFCQRMADSLVYQKKAKFTRGPVKTGSAQIMAGLEALAIKECLEPETWKQCPHYKDHAKEQGIELD